MREAIKGRYERKEGDFQYLTEHPELADEAFELMNSYAKEHDLDMTYGGAAAEIMVRHLLHSEQVGYNFTPEQRDYYIKTCMGIIPLDKEYERQIGYFGQSNAA